MPIRRLQTRIVVAFVTVVCVLQGAAFVVVNVTGEASTQRSLDHELTTGARFFDRLLVKDLSKLDDGARNLATQEQFRAAIRAGDAAGIASSLAYQVEHGRSDVAMVIDARHRIVADTSARRDAIASSRSPTCCPGPMPPGSPWPPRSSTASSTNWP